MRCAVRKDDGAEWVGHRTQHRPIAQVGGAEDRVNAGRTLDSKLKCSNWLPYADELDRYRISEHGHGLISQRGDQLRQIGRSQRFR